jgi:hypothetical protein
MRDIKYVDENFEVRSYPIFTVGDLVRLVDTRSLKIETFTQDRVYRVFREEGEGFGTPAKIGIIANDGKEHYVYAMRFEFVEAEQGDLLDGPN